MYDVHEWVAGVASKTPRWRVANTGHEAEFIGRADAVVTVSDRLAEMLQERYRLAAASARRAQRAAVRARRAERRTAGCAPPAGSRTTSPLLVYSGSAAPQRGIDTVVDALVHLPAVHLALVVSHPRRAEEITAHAVEAGVEGRVHILPYVPQQEVVPFLRSATAGLIPIHHFPNHEIALITKYFEYAHAGLPIITSDTETMGTTTARARQRRGLRRRGRRATSCAPSPR